MMAMRRRKKRTARVENAMIMARLIGLSRIDPERDSDAGMGEDVEVGEAVPPSWLVLSHG